MRHHVDLKLLAQQVQVHVGERVWALAVACRQDKPIRCAAQPGWICLRERTCVADKSSERLPASKHRVRSNLAGSSLDCCAVRHVKQERHDAWRGVLCPAHAARRTQVGCVVWCGVVCCGVVCVCVCV